VSSCQSRLWRRLHRRHPNQKLSLTTPPSTNVKYVFGAAPPVARLKPGNILDADSLDCFGNALQKPGDSFSLVKGDNPLTGPFYIEGAEPGDTLVVHLLDLQVDGKQGVGTFSPGIRRHQRHALHSDAREGSPSGEDLVLPH